MKSKLLLISIGPVQEFIASARKLRDLWFGSQMLSELSKTVAREVFIAKGKLIFPGIQNLNELDEFSELNVANKILAILSEDIDPEKLIHTVESAVKERIKSYKEATLNGIRKIGVEINQDMFDKQINDFGEFYAVWVEYNPGNSESYSIARDEVEHLLAARKNLRMFSKPAWIGEGIFKNSLDGVRETVITKQHKIPGLLKKSEKLDAIGLIKRFHPIGNNKSNQKFSDLSEVALLPWFKRIKKEGRHEIKREFESCLKKDFPKEYYYAESSEELETDKPDSKEKAWKLLKKLRSKDCAGEPFKYACILVGDGDKMGVALDQIKTVEGHRTFSQGLSTFASGVKKLIEEYEGSLVYSGGDDVVAYLPVHNAIECSDKIRCRFYKDMEEILESLKLKMDDVPTFSIGLAIVHHFEPLDQALNKARKAEQIAKNDSERNSLAIVQSKRSGGDTIIYGKWDSYQPKEGIASRLQKMVLLYCNEEQPLPATLGYQLREALNEAGNELEFVLEKEKIKPRNASSALVLRALRQKDKTSESKLEEYFKSVLLGSDSIRFLSNELIITKQIADAVQLCGNCKGE